MAFEQANINYAVEYSKQLANTYAYTQYFTDIIGAQNSQKYKVLNAATIQIPSIETSGSQAVNRNSITGAFQRNFNLTNEAKTMSQYREFKTLIDAEDVAQTNLVANVANVSETFETIEKPAEMSAYIASSLAGFAQAVGGIDTTVLSASNILAQWDSYIQYMTDNRVNRDRVICYIIPSVYKLLKEAAGITRFIGLGDGIRDFDRNVAKLDGVRIYEVPSNLMKSAVDPDNAYAPASGATQTNLLLVDPEAVMAPIVYDVAMASAPTAQSQGKWLFYESFYFDCFNLSKRWAGVFANVTAAASLGSITVTSVADATSGTDISTGSYELPAGVKFVYKSAAVAPTVTAGTALDGTWADLPDGGNVTGATGYITVAAVNQYNLMPIASGNAAVVNH